MAVGNALIDYVLDQLEDFSASARQMFGGVALYRGDAMFGFGYQDRIYFKVDDRNRDEYLRAGMGALILLTHRTRRRNGLARSWKFPLKSSTTPTNLRRGPPSRSMLR